VLNQTYQNFELIIVDDGSTDNTEEVVKSFTDNRIIYYKHEKNKGVLAARNTGWDLAKGKYNCKLDDDDELLPEALETAVNKFIELAPQGVKILWFDCIDAETGKFSGSGIRKEGYIAYEDFLCGRIRGDYWPAMDMDLLRDTRLDERLWAGGTILWLKLQRKSRIYHMPKVLAKAYRKHGERLSSPWNSLKHISRVTLTQKVFLEEHGEELKRLCPKVYGQRLAQWGSCQIRNGDKLAGRKTLRKSFGFNFSLKHLIVYLLSFVLNKNQMIALYAAHIKLLGIKRTTAIPINALGKVISRIKTT